MTTPNRLTIGDQSPVKYNLQLDSNYLHQLKTMKSTDNAFPPGPQFYRDGNILIAEKESLMNMESTTSPVQATTSLNGIKRLSQEEFCEKFEVLGLTVVENDPGQDVIKGDALEGIAVRCGGGSQLFASVRNKEGIYPGQTIKVVAPSTDTPPIPFEDSTFDNYNTGQGKQYIPQIAPVDPNHVVDSWISLSDKMVRDDTPPYKKSESQLYTMPGQKNAFKCKTSILSMAFTIIQLLVERNILHIVKPNELASFGVYQDGIYADTKADFQINVAKIDQEKVFDATYLDKFQIEEKDVNNRQHGGFNEAEKTREHKEDSLIWLASVLGLAGLSGDEPNLFNENIMKSAVAASLGGLVPLGDKHLYPNLTKNMAWTSKINELRTLQSTAGTDLMSSIAGEVSKEFDKVLGVAMTGVQSNQQYVERMLVKLCG